MATTIKNDIADVNLISKYTGLTIEEILNYKITIIIMYNNIIIIYTIGLGKIMPIYTITDSNIHSYGFIEILPLYNNV